MLRSDSLLLARGYGYSNVEGNVPATDSTAYESGSVAKPFTAAAVVTLSEQGRLSLDDPITRFLPEGTTTWRGITLRHLLTHTSGVSSRTLDPDRSYTEDELVGLAAGQPVQFAAGDQWSYSSTGYVLLGAIVHRVTGASYADFLRKHIFKPLGVHAVPVTAESGSNPNRATGYSYLNDTLGSQDVASRNPTADCCLLLTVHDLVSWGIGLNHGRPLSGADLDASWSPVRLNSGGTYPYGFGWHLKRQRGYRRIGHSGSSDGFQTTIQRYPDFDLTVIVAQSLPEAMASSIAGILEPGLLPPHRLQRPVSETSPPKAIERLLQNISAAADSAQIDPGLKTFIDDSYRQRLRRRIIRYDTWVPLGCDAVEGRDVSRFSTRVAWICYAKGLGSKPELLATVLYGASWRVAGIDLYSF